MNPNELAMIIAYAQGQQIAGRWTFNVAPSGAGYYEWDTDTGTSNLIMTDGGFLYATTANDIEPVPVFNLTHLIALISASNQAG